MYLAHIYLYLRDNYICTCMFICNLFLYVDNHCLLIVKFYCILHEECQINALSCKSKYFFKGMGLAF